LQYAKKPLREYGTSILKVYGFKNEIGIDKKYRNKK